jgi:molybdate transport system ATP-binding protein
VGAVIEGTVGQVDATMGLARLDIGANELTVSANGLRMGQRVRVHLLARDLILATEQPRALSVRNILQGSVISTAPDDAQTQQIEIDIGGATVLARVTDDASTQLKLTAGSKVWVLVKAVSLRGHVFPLASATSLRAE